LLREKEQYISSLVLDGYAFINDHVLILTRKGKLLADKIAVDLFSSED
jgi:hypothetical protein